MTISVAEARAKTDARVLFIRLSKRVNRQYGGIRPVNLGEGPHESFGKTNGSPLVYCDDQRSGGFERDCSGYSWLPESSYCEGCKAHYGITEGPHESPAETTKEN